MSIFSVPFRDVRRRGCTAVVQSVGDEHHSITEDTSKISAVGCIEEEVNDTDAEDVQRDTSIQSHPLPTTGFFDFVPFS